MRLNKLTQTIFLLPMVGIMFSCEDNGSTTAYDTQQGTEQVAEAAMDDDDKEEMLEFVKEAISDGMMEIKMAEMAMGKSTNTEVKDLAKTIKNDHQKASDQLKKLAKENNWEIPSQMIEKHQKKVDKLNDVSMEDFDEKYLEMIENGHEKAIKEFKDANDDKDEVVMALNNWIEETLPVLKKHKERADALEDQIDD